MSEQFYTILTNTGKAKIANSLPTGQKLNLVKMKIGDSNGKYYNPAENQTDLVHKVYECNITSVDVDETNPQWITITSVIPSDVGGFSIREVGVFDDTNSLIAIGKYPETYKPIASDGSTKELYIKMTLEVTNASSVELKIDPTVILATKKDINTLDKKIENNTTQLNEKGYKTSISALEYGCDNTGTEDCTDKFNAMIESGYKHIVVDDGTYLLTTLTVPAGVTISGNGRTTFLKCKNNSNGRFIKLSSYCKLENICLTCDEFETNATTGLYLINSHATRISNVRIENFTGYGVRVEFPSYDCILDEIVCANNKNEGFSIKCTDIWLNNCIASGNVGHGFRFAMSENYINNCKAYQNGYNSASKLVTGNSDGFHIEKFSDSTATAQGIRLVNCDAQENARHGLMAESVEFIQIDNFMSDSNGLLTENNELSGVFLSNVKRSKFTGQVMNKTYLLGTQRYGVYVSDGCYENDINFNVGQMNGLNTIYNDDYIKSSSKVFEKELNCLSGLQNTIIINGNEMGYINKFIIKRFTSVDTGLTLEQGTLSVLTSVNEVNNEYIVTATNRGSDNVKLKHNIECQKGQLISVDLQYSLKPLESNTEGLKVGIYIKFLNSSGNMIEQKYIERNFGYYMQEFTHLYINNQQAPENCTNVEISYRMYMTSYKGEFRIKPPYVTLI